MKNFKQFTFLSVIALFYAFSINAQNLIENGDFEDASSWQNGITGAIPPEWDVAQYCQKETAIKFGTAACKMTGNNNAVLTQTTYYPIAGLTQGDTYELSFKYYVVTSAGSTDIRMNSSWTGSTHDQTNLQQQFSATQVGVWETKTITTTAPAGVTKFTLSVKVPSGATVIFDDFDFHKVTTSPTELTITISPSATQQFSTTINTPVTKNVTVTTANLPNPATISFGGTNAALFSASHTSVPANGTTVVTITYLTTAAGNHTANMTVDCSCTLSASSNNVLYLQGSATNPSLPPSIAILPTSHTFNTIEVGKKDTAEFVVTTANIPTSGVNLIARLVNPNGQFLILGNNIVVKNGTTTIKVEFRPNSENTFNAQLEIYSDNGTISSVFANISGTATGATTPPEKEGDNYPLSSQPPLSIMNETFDNQTHNQPLSINGWKNIAEENYRAWWGYRFESTDVPNYAAKATAFNSVNTAPDPYEMWLYTPPLDFVNASPKIFTFKIMGQNMADDNVATLEVYYVENDIPLYREKINIEIPKEADYNNVWVPYIMDLTGQNIADVFYIGFRFYVAHGGNQNSVVYYIDDVTWGIGQNSVNEISEDTDIVWAKDKKLFIYSKDSGSAILYNISGIMLEKYDFTSGISEFPHNLQSGIYFLQIKHNNSYSAKKIVIGK